MWLCVGMVFIQWSHRNSFSSLLHVLVVSFLNLSGRFQTNTHPQTQRQWLTSLAWFRSSLPYSKFQQNMNKLWTKVILEILTKVIANSRQYSRVLLHKFYWPHKGVIPTMVKGTWEVPWAKTLQLSWARIIWSRKMAVHHYIPWYGRGNQLQKTLYTIKRW